MSLQAQHDPKNEAEITYWNSAGGRRWVERQQSQDIVLGPILQATLERAQLRQGERVVDTGCGTGATSIALAEHVGPSGRVLGVDVSAPMLARAAERLPPGALVKFVRADATTYRFESAEFDLLFSRFAAMFFAEPARAFANLRTALKPSGRLAFACWRFQGLTVSKCALDAKHTREDLDALIALAPDYKPGPAPGALPLTYFDELTDQPTPKPWVIKFVLARGELSSWIAPPGAGKSSLFAEIAIHAAAGMAWRGYRVKQRTGVVIFAFERADLTKRRLIAHRRRDGLRNLPIAVYGKLINMLDPACADIILATIREAEQHMGCEVGLIIFDTYAKGIAAGDGDEDKARDQNKVHANLRRLFELGGNFHIAGVGHTGKDESRGERGSNARLADVDLQVQISGDDIRTATVTKANDQPEGLLTRFKLEAFDFELDEDGDPFQVSIVSAAVIPAAAQGSKRQKTTDRQTLALRALADVVLRMGQDPPATYQLPQGIKVVTLKDWEEELYRENVLDRDDLKHAKSRFKELRDGLAARCLIGMRDIWVWSAARPI